MMKKLTAKLKRPDETRAVLTEMIKMLNTIAETADTINSGDVPGLKRILCTIELDSKRKTMACTSAIIPGMPYELSQARKRILEEKEKIKAVIVEEDGLKRQDEPMSINIGGPI